MVHLRIVSPHDVTEQVMDVLTRDSVINVIRLDGAARRPDGDVILCDVAREDASVTLSDLKELDIHRTGSIALESVETQISLFAERADQAIQGIGRGRAQAGDQARQSAVRQRAPNRQHPDRADRRRQRKADHGAA